jgi:hypothetical protein
MSALFRLKITYSHETIGSNVSDLMRCRFGRTKLQYL